MPPSTPSHLRRILLPAPLLLAFPALLPAQAPLTAADAWTRIHTHYAATSPADTVDTLKGGDPATTVTGIATTFLDTLDVLREAVRRGDNLIISHEPTFYNHRDNVAQFSGDPVYRAKRDFIAEHHLIVYRLHDAIHANPDDDHILSGLYTALGWQTYPHPTGPRSRYFVTIPPTTLEQLAKYLQTKLNIQTLRLEGRPDLPITRVALLPGASGLDRQVLALTSHDTEVLIAGEASEWETVEYVRDAVAEGRPKALILLGHEVSEEPGMEQATQDLRALFPGLRVDHIPANQPLWNPDHPPTTK